MSLEEQTPVVQIEDAPIVESLLVEQPVLHLFASQLTSPALIHSLPVKLSTVMSPTGQYLDDSAEFDTDSLTYFPQL
jgi:hypothetical protein